MLNKHPTHRPAEGYLAGDGNDVDEQSRQEGIEHDGNDDHRYHVAHHQDAHPLQPTAIEEGDGKTEWQKS